MLTDLRFAVRTLLRNWSFSLAAILTLSLGLGATTAIFSVVNGVLLRPLPYPDADRIVTIETTWRNRGLTSGNVSGPDFRDWQRQSSSFEAMACTYGGEMGVKAGQYGEFTGIFMITPDFFKVMRVLPVAGRFFSSEEQKPNGANAALISETFAESHYGSPEAALGRILRIASQSFPIVGVIGEGFHYPIRGTTKVVHALDALGVHLIEAGFPASNPKEQELFGLLARERLERAEIVAFGMTRRRDVAADARRGAAGARRLLRAGRARSSARPRCCTSRRSCASRARRTSR